MLRTTRELEDTLYGYQNMKAYVIYSRGSSVGSMTITKKGLNRPLYRTSVELGSEVDNILAFVGEISVEELLKIIK